jgi:hypothetical protein
MIGNQTREQAMDRSLQRVVWGDNVSGGPESESRWAFVRFEAGQHPLAACGNPFADTDDDGDVDQADFGIFQSCYTMGTSTLGTGCACLDLDETGTVDQDDVRFFLGCTSGPDIAASVSCDD